MVFSRREMKKGYTLIELILVVSVFLLITTLGIARFNEFNERQVVAQSADTFISNLRLIQAKALSGDKPDGCTTLTGYTVEFAFTNYTMYAQCDPEGIIDTPRVAVNLPANVNLNPPSGTVTYYSGGKGISSDQQVQIVGRSVTIPVVFAAGSITKLTPL